MTTRRRRSGLWNRLSKNWFQLTIAFSAIIHMIAFMTGKIDITTFGGSFAVFVTTISSIKSALKDDDTN
jgi:hypothetical protein